MRIPKLIVNSICLCIVVTFPVGTPHLYAQLGTGQIAGTVMDQTGAAVPNAAVTIKNLSSNAERNTVSSASGSYMAPGLEPSVYQVTVTSSNFKPFVAKVPTQV